MVWMAIQILAFRISSIVLPHSFPQTTPPISVIPHFGLDVTKSERNYDYLTQRSGFRSLIGDILNSYHLSLDIFCVMAPSGLAIIIGAGPNTVSKLSLSQFFYQIPTSCYHEALLCNNSNLARAPA
jgi:hypothetical protein